VLLAAAPALAAGAQKAGPSEVVFLGQVILLLSVGRLTGEAMQRIGQPAVMGQLLAGFLLGPSVLGALWPEVQHAIFPADREQMAMIGAVSQLGILMLLLLTGMETDLSLVRKAGRAALSVSATGIAVPFACGFALGEFLPEAMLPRPDLRLITSLFLGTALSISSVKIVAMVVRETGFMRRNLGQVIVASAIIDDTIGWTIIAVIFGLALHGSLDPATLARSVLGTALFLALSFTIGRRLVFTLIRWTNDTFVSDMPVITTILVVMGLMVVPPSLRTLWPARRCCEILVRLLLESGGGSREVRAAQVASGILASGRARRRPPEPVEGARDRAVALAPKVVRRGERGSDAGLLLRRVRIGACAMAVPQRCCRDSWGKVCGAGPPRSIPPPRSGSLPQRVSASRVRAMAIQAKEAADGTTQTQVGRQAVLHRSHDAASK
jgi:hypothetical protein